MISQKVLVDGIKSIKMSGSESDTSDSEGDGKGESIPLATTTTRTVSLDKPETDQAVSQVAEIYAPHMTTISNAFGGTFDVSYTLNVNVDRNNDKDKNNI